jgi:PKD repeat protein
MMSSRRIAASTFFILLLAIVVGCDRVPLTAPTESTITLSASNLVLPVNGSTEIIASVTEKPGTPVQNGTVVTFTTTVGTIEPREARTQGGKVTARLFAGGQSGAAKVGAFSGSARATEIEVKIGGAAAETLNLIVSPATLPSAGGSAEVVATVSDASGNRLGGVPVTFTTSSGTVSPSTVVTDTNGEARATLSTTRQAEVTAAAGSKTQRVTVGLNAAPTVSISTSANPTEDQPTTFTINVGSAAGGSSVRNVTIDYGDGRVEQLGAQTGSVTVTHIYSSPGTYTVRVNVTDSSGETTPATTVINVAPATPVGVNLTAQPPNPRVRENVAFTATVSPATAQIREYRWDFGDGTTRTTTGNQTNHFYDRVGQRTITVTAVNVDGRTHRGETEIIVQPAAP